MDEIQTVNEALAIIERYADYLARKAWGKMLIIWGIIAPIGLMLYFNRHSLSSLVNMDVDSFTILSSISTVLIGIGLTIYNFTAASRLLKSTKDQTVQTQKDSGMHGIVIGFIWFLLFILASLIPDPFSVVSTVWAAGLAIIISFWLLKNYFHDAFPELLVVGLILLASSIPLVILIMIDMELALVQSLTIVTYSISFLTGGFYSITKAKDILRRN